MSNSQAMTMDAQANMAGGGEDGFCEVPQPAPVPVELRKLLNGAHFRFVPHGPTFERLKSGFRTHPDGDNGRWFPLDLNTQVYAVQPLAARSENRLTISGGSRARCTAATTLKGIEMRNDQEIVDQTEAQQPAHVTSEHRLYTTSDADRPREICDRNGEVVLGLCKVCGRAEAELDKPCTHNAAREGR